MTQAQARYFLARVTLPVADDMQTLADFFTRLMPGFRFEEESTGRFDEVPAFVATQNGMEFILMGVPEGEVGDDYVLEFECETDLPVNKFLEKDAGGFVRRFLEGRAVDDSGFLDCSQALAQLLIECGIPECEPIRPIGPAKSVATR